MKYKEGAKIEFISNIPNEILFVGSIYKQPDLLIEYGQFVRSKYDFYDEVTRFFFDNAEIIYKTRTQTFNKTTISTYFTEDTEKLSQYKKYGGWKTLESWMKLAIPDDIKNYQEVLKKYSLLREYQKNGFNIEKIINHSKFESFTAQDIYRLIRGKADRIHTVILTNEEAEPIDDNIQSMLLECMEKPDMGIMTPFPIINEMFRGLKLKSTMAIGMLSNSGKTRFMTKIVAYITLVLGQKVLLLLNEMSILDVKKCLICTVINNPEFQKIHGIKINKPERELVLGLYKDKKGDFIYRKTNNNGEFVETLDEYIERVRLSSEEYNQVMQVAKWVESTTDKLILAKDLSTGYDDKTLEFEIRKAHLIHNIDYWFYDTFKSDVSAMGDWSAMKATETKLTSLTQELNMFGYLSFQLTDDAEFVKPNELTSNNIANCKQIKHDLWTLGMLKEIRKEDFYKYGYIQRDEEWGENTTCDLDLTKRYYIFNCDKNRFGNKLKIVFEVDLDLNIWIEKGILVKK